MPAQAMPNICRCFEPIMHMYMGVDRVPGPHMLTMYQDGSIREIEAVYKSAGSALVELKAGPGSCSSLMLAGYTYIPMLQ